MNKLKAPITYFGGKFYLAQEIIKLFPEHKTYCEVFAGSGQVLFAKQPSSIEIYNDLESKVVNFYRVLRDKDKYQELIRLLSLTPYSREEFYNCRDTLENEQDDIQKAWLFFITARQSFASKQDSWGFVVTDSNANMASQVSKYLSSINLLPVIHKRLQRVQIENKDFKDIIKNYDTKDTLFYCDPPYLSEVRQTFNDYKHEMSYEDHVELIELLKNIEGKAILSGYDNELYNSLLECSWDKKEFDIMLSCEHTKDLVTRQRRTETLWFNYQEPQLSLF